jgi:anti-sigma B factor antagonist
MRIYWTLVSIPTSNRSALTPNAQITEDGSEGGNMEIRERQVGDVVILDLLGRMTVSDGDQLFRDKIYSLVHQSRANVIVNLGGIAYVDSAGLGAIVASYTTVTRAGGRLGLVNLTKGIHSLLTITKLLTVFSTYASEDEALRSFGLDTSVTSDEMV